MALGRKTGGRQKGARNRATEEARAAAAATGTLPLHHMLSVLRDPTADHKRRDAMAMAAAPHLHPRLTAIDAKLNPDALEPSERKLVLEFVLPTRDHAREDQEQGVFAMLEMTDLPRARHRHPPTRIQPREDAELQKLFAHLALQQAVLATHAAALAMLLRWADDLRRKGPPCAPSTP
jgi:hypothetical protein